MYFSANVQKGVLRVCLLTYVYHVGIVGDYFVLIEPICKQMTLILLSPAIFVEKKFISEKRVIGKKGRVGNDKC